MSTLTGLGSQVLDQATLLADLFSKSGLQAPTWDEMSPADFQTGNSHRGEISQARAALMDSLLDMVRLVLGPTEVLRSLITAAVSLNTSSYLQDL